MTTISIADWSEFEKAVEAIRVKSETSERPSKLLFRGVGNSDWGLETTLERASPMERSGTNTDFFDYYQRIYRSKSAIGSLAARNWLGLEDPFAFKDRIQANPTWMSQILNKETGLVEYLVYLRHHGFPSPLLDWTASAHIATFFALNNPPSGAQKVGVYGLRQDSVHGGGNSADLCVIGPYMQAHARHTLQQCQYTMCTGFGGDPTAYWFVDHLNGLADALGPDGELVKIEIPISVREVFLRRLDSININAYSLFTTEDSLIATVARREMLFHK